MLGHSVARAATRVAARPGATIGRIVCLSTSRGSVEQAVLRLCEQHGTAASSQEALDNLTLKFKLLSACEREFGCAIPNARLAGVKTVEDAISYFQERVGEREQAQTMSETHWSRSLPPNVTLDEDGVVGLDGVKERRFKIRPRRQNDAMGLR